MKSLQIEYPESVLAHGHQAAAGSSPERFEGEARMALAMKSARFDTSPNPLPDRGGEGVPAVAWDAAEISAELKPLQW